MDLERNVHCLMGLPVDAVDMAGAVQRVRHAALTNTRCFVSTPNLNFVMAACRDEAFRDSVLHSDLCLADGMPLVWVARLLGLPIRERVSGAGLFESLLMHPGPPITAYFFGGPDGVAQAACKRVNDTGKGLRCVGFDAPGFGSVQDLSGADRIDRINSSGAHFIIVALGAKKGQAWIEHNQERLLAPVLCHLGAVVNFAAGSVQRAPRWVQAMGAEWLWRIKEEPGLWRRYWDDGVCFIDVLVRNVLPLAAQRLRRPLSPDATKGSLITSRKDRKTTLALEGVWTRDQLEPLRQAVRTAYAAQTDLVVDLARATHVDNACLGLLLLARGGFRQPSGLVVKNATEGVAATFARSGTSWLLQPATQEGA